MLMERKKKDGGRKNQTIEGKMNWTLAEQLGSTVTPAGSDGNYPSAGWKADMKSRRFSVKGEADMNNVGVGAEVTS